MEERNALPQTGSHPAWTAHTRATLGRPRYEYRVWDSGLAGVRKELKRLAVGSPASLSKETYLISDKTDDCNLKIRAERLNMKELIATENGLELWNPVLDCEFPLHDSTIIDHIFPRLALKSPALQRRLYSMDDFLDWIQVEPSIRVVTIIKKRTRFRLAECLAEFTYVTIDKRESGTVAVESINPDAVSRLVHRLRIADIPNTSYIRQLKQILGDRSNASTSDRRESRE